MSRGAVFVLLLLLAAGAAAYVVVPRRDGEGRDARPGPVAGSESAASRSEPPALAPKPQDPAARRPLRARLVTVDERTGDPVDPQSPFGLSIGTGAEWAPGMDWGRRQGLLHLRASLPPAAAATDLVVTIEGWGYLPYRGVFSIRARADGAEEEIRVPLRQVPEEAWTTQRIVLEGPGDAVGEDEVAAVEVSPQGAVYGPPMVLVEFTPGSPRRREVRVPAQRAQVVVVPIRIPVAGPNGERRTAWIDPRATATTEWKAGAAGEPPTTTVRHAPHAVLVMEVRYPPGTPRPAFEMYGSQSDRVHRDDGREGGLAMTYGALVTGGPDVLRILFKESELRLLTVRGRSVQGTWDPQGPFRLRPPEVVRASLVLSPAPDAGTPPK